MALARVDVVRHAVDALALRLAVRLLDPVRGRAEPDATPRLVAVVLDDEVDDVAALVDGGLILVLVDKDLDRHALPALRLVEERLAPGLEELLLARAERDAAAGEIAVLQPCRLRAARRQEKRRERQQERHEDTESPLHHCISSLI